jgi:hypothetical protein
MHAPFLPRGKTPHDFTDYYHLLAKTHVESLLLMKKVKK